MKIEAGVSITAAESGIEVAAFNNHSNSKGAMIERVERSFTALFM